MADITGTLIIILDDLVMTTVASLGSSKPPVATVVPVHTDGIVIPVRIDGKVSPC